MKKNKFIGIIVCFCLVLQTLWVNHANGAKAAAGQLTMTEYYKQVMALGRKGSDVAESVIISDWQDYLMFRDCMTKKDATIMYPIRWTRQAEGIA